METYILSWIFAAVGVVGLVRRGGRALRRARASGGGARLRAEARCGGARIVRQPVGRRASAQQPDVPAEHFATLKHGLDVAVGAYNKTIGTLETRVLVSARRFHQLEAASATEIPELDVVELATRATQASELLGAPEEVGLPQ